MSRMERRICCGLTMLMLAIGCRGSQHPELRHVTGQLVYHGAPVADAVVAFYNDESPRAATGRTDEHGNFDLTTFEDKDGALPGEHTVVITKTSVIEDNSRLSMDEAVSAPRAKAKPRQLLPAKYASVETSPLRLTVAEKGPNVFTIELNDDK